MLLELVMWHCTADAEAAKSRYGQLTSVDATWLPIRKIVQKKKPKAWAFVQGNTFLRTDGKVELKEYESTPIGVIQSWVERLASME